MKMYVEPIVNLLYLQNEDVLTGSDNYESDILVTRALCLTIKKV